MKGDFTKFLVYTQSNSTDLCSDAEEHTYYYYCIIVIIITIIVITIRMPPKLLI